jgi:hypothetical protein
LNGDGVHTVDNLHGVQFDLTANGSKQTTGWVDRHDALLVRDINHDGQINNGKELFGTSTVLKNGTQAGDGWAALADLDTNGDGKVDAKDAAFAELKVWVDANGDGVSTPEELRSLTDAGIQSINVGHDGTTVIENGNYLFGAGQFTKTDGSTAAVTDAWFKGAANVNLDLSKVTSQIVDLTDGDAQTLTINAKDLLAYNQAHGALLVTGDKADAVDLLDAGAAVAAQAQTINGQVFSAYDLNQDGVNDLLIAQAMNQTQLF